METGGGLYKASEPADPAAQPQMAEPRPAAAHLSPAAPPRTRGSRRRGGDTRSRSLPARQGKRVSTSRGRPAARSLPPPPPGGRAPPARRDAGRRPPPPRTEARPGLAAGHGAAPEPRACGPSRAAPRSPPGRGAAPRRSRPR